QHLVERVRGAFLRRGLPGAVDGKSALLDRPGLDRAGGGGDLLEHLLLQGDIGADAGDRVVEARESGKLRIERDGDAALRAEAAVGLRLLTAAELLLQGRQLVVDVQHRLDQRRKLRGNACHAHSVLTTPASGWSASG